MSSKINLVFGSSDLISQNRKRFKIKRNNGVQAKQKCRICGKSF